MIRSRNIHLLHQQMLAKKKSADIGGAVITAKEILDISPRQRQIMEDVADVFLAENLIDEAKSAINFIEAHFHHNPYLYVLKAQLAYTVGDYKSVLACAPHGINAPEIAPFYKAILYNIIAKVHLALGDAEKGAVYFLHSSQLPDNPSQYWEYSNYLFALQHNNISQQELFRIIKNYDNMFRGIKRYEHKSINNHDRMRIGYITADYCNGVAAHFTYALFAAYDRERFAVYAYNLGHTDNITIQFKKKATYWREIQTLSLAEAAALIYADELDILIDLSGHTNHSGLPIMAYKPAPIQVSGIGWMNSTGLSAIDYFLTDVNVDPVGVNDVFFTEKLIRLPHSHFCYEPFASIKPMIKSAPCVRNGYITFGSFNRFAKLTNETLAMWAEVLNMVTDARLILRSHNFDIPLAREIAIKKMKQAGIDINRIQLKGFVVDYFTAYGEIDIALDTFPYPGGGTTCDALYAGVPVVSLAGSSHNSRFGYSILKNIGLQELCAFTPIEYIKICVELSKEHELLNRLHFILQKHMLESPVMNKTLYMHDLEEYYCKIVYDKWER